MIIRIIDKQTKTNKIISNLKDNKKRIQTSQSKIILEEMEMEMMMMTKIRKIAKKIKRNNKIKRKDKKETNKERSKARKESQEITEIQTKIV